MTAQLKATIPKLPARNLQTTRSFYEALNFVTLATYHDYLIVNRDGLELHFFLYHELDVLTNYGMCYIRVSGIEALYAEVKSKSASSIRGVLELKPWRQKEFAIVDLDHNLLTFGESA